MKEYISKEYIHNLLNRHLNDWCGPEYYTCSIIQDEIDDAPIADVIELRHGRWIVENGNIVCSVCHTGKPTADGYEMMICDGKKFVSMERTNFCGNCGAKMDSKGECAC